MSAIPQDIMAAAAAAHADFARSTVRDNLTLIIARAIMAERQRSYLLPAQTEPDAGRVEGPYQDRVAQAHHALFHDDPTDVSERLARFFEEAAETCQALGMTHDDASKLLAYTFSRPVGDPAKEIGSAKLTLASLCVVAGYDMDACGEADLEKLQRPETIARIRAKRATRHGRGPLPGFDPTPPSPPREEIEHQGVEEGARG